MRFDPGKGYFWTTGALTATNAVPSTAADGQAIPSSDTGVAVPDALSVVVILAGAAAGATVESVLYCYNAALTAWIPSAPMKFGNGVSCLADTTNRDVSAQKSVFLPPWASRAYLLIDEDNAVGAPTSITGYLYADEWRERR